MKKSPSGLRPFKLQPSFLPHAEGSCLVSMGDTQVLCVATLEEKAPPHAQEKGIGWIHAEYSMLPRSGERRTSRSRATTGGRSQEISRLIGRALRSAVDLRKLAGTSVIIDCDVIRADGGTRTASINGGLVALVQALQVLKKKNLIQHWPLKDFVGAVSIGLVGKKQVVDMSYEHDKIAETDLNVVMNGQGQLIEVQGTAEGDAFSTSQLNAMIKSATKAISAVIKAQKNVVGSISRVKIP